MPSGMKRFSGDENDGQKMKLADLQITPKKDLDLLHESLAIVYHFEMRE